ncbi:uncharacterized protein FIBRA_07436 [Fibroporia radiculosa]|uniref:Protein farnesyltransferase subunit beta n=1 Tax=Fibroporia radiculosa TaxID=599839 RepID=J4IBT6_9APHY|nr:uncharacterized protein FIBRA_07436 [Fibroporia radiculosa]CCM05226.1 predicted protein [Fibroporia radiculosa]
MVELTRTFRPTPSDGLPTSTSVLQKQTEELVVKQLSHYQQVQPNPNAGPPSASLPTEPELSKPLLERKLHLQFLLRNMLQGFPQRYVSQDASQPWLMFWTLQGFSVLGVGLDDKTKKRARDTLLALQHPEGGFCGGPGQAAHLLATYASVCSLAIVGQPGIGGAWDEVDRKKMYDFFMSLKQTDGSFLVAHHAESWILFRYASLTNSGIYCLLAVATLLNIITPELLSGLPEFIVSCQTYEGGFGNASFPEWVFQKGEDSTISFDPSAPRPVLGEAHGGYTFCATASWVLLQPYVRAYYSSPIENDLSSNDDAQSPGLPLPSINYLLLLRWLVRMQGTEIELGGFKGRTNKLVDGCYSWWVGGCLALVEAFIGLGDTEKHAEVDYSGDTGTRAEEDAWHDIDDGLLNREALQEYILYAGQHPAGGLRDKPPKPADAYHTLYCLSGLSAAQHHVAPDESRKTKLIAGWKAEDAQQKAGVCTAQTSTDNQARAAALRRYTFTDALCWLEDEGADKYVGGSGNRVNATQPLFNLTVTHTELMMAHFYGQTLPPRVAQTPAKK